MARERDPYRMSFADLAAVRWDSAPLDDWHRTAAGQIRNFAAFYEPRHRATALAVERFLSRYSYRHSHTSLGGASRRRTAPLHRHVHRGR